MKKKRGKAKTKKKAASGVSFEERIKKNTEIEKEKIILLLFLIFVVLVLIILFQPKKEPFTGAATSDLIVEKTKFNPGEKLQGKIVLGLHPEDILPPNATFLIRILTNASKCSTRYVCPDNTTVPWYIFNVTTQQCELIKPDPEGDCCLRAGANCKQAILNKQFNPGLEEGKIERWAKLFYPRNAFDPGAIGIEEVAVGAEDEITIFSFAAYHDSSFQQVPANGTLILQQNLLSRNFKVADLGPPVTPYCREDDAGMEGGGKNPYIKGTCWSVNRSGYFEHQDRCVNNSTTLLEEWYCTGASCQKEIIDCGKLGGKCENGKCVPISQPPQLIFCYDSDGGRNYSEGGLCYLVINNSTIVQEDKCVNNTLYECYCGNNTILYETVNCSTGKVCDKNRCSSLSAYCFDDDGENYYIQGTCSDLEGIFRDTCIGGELIEYYCANSTCKSRTIKCPLGCSNGRCVPLEGPVTGSAIQITGSATSQLVEPQYIPLPSLKWAVAWQDVLGEGKNCAFEVVVKSNNNRSLHYYYNLSNVCRAPASTTNDKYIILGAPAPSEDPSYPDGIFWKNETRDLYADWKSNFGAEATEDIIAEIKLISYTKQVGDSFYGQKVWWDYITLSKPDYFEAKSCSAHGKKCCAKGTGFGTYFGDQLKCEIPGTECWSSCADSAYLTLTQFIQRSNNRNKENRTEGECQFVKDGQVISLDDYCYANEAGRGYTACLNTGTNAPMNCRNWTNTYELNLTTLNMKAPTKNGSYTLEVNFFYVPKFQPDPDQPIVHEIFSKIIPFTVGELAGPGGGGVQEEWECNWSQCLNGLQLGNCTELLTGRRATRNRTCCWSCTPWDPAECPESRIQTRICLASFTDDCPIQSAEKPNETQTCTPSVPECTINDWQCGDYGKCINGVKTRQCTKISNCEGGYTPETEISCRKGAVVSGITLYIIIVIIAAAVAILLFFKVLRKGKTKPLEKTETKVEKAKARYPEVVSYIKEALEAGASRNEIEKKLLEAGWPKDIIDESFSAVGK